MQKLKRIRANIKDNLWRLPGIVGLAYVVAWFYALFGWYIPMQNRTLNPSITLPVSVFESAFGILFVTVGVVLLVVCGFLAVVLVFKK